MSWYIRYFIMGSTTVPAVSEKADEYSRINYRYYSYHIAILHKLIWMYLDRVRGVPHSLDEALLAFCCASTELYVEAIQGAAPKCLACWCQHVLASTCLMTGKHASFDIRNFRRLKTHLYSHDSHVYSLPGDCWDSQLQGIWIGHLAMFDDQVLP